MRNSNASMDQELQKWMLNKSCDKQYEGWKTLKQLYMSESVPAVRGKKLPHTPPFFAPSSSAITAPDCRSMPGLDCMKLSMSKVFVFSYLV